VGTRTGISEDPKGDPTKILPNQPVPGGRGVEPLSPKSKSSRPGKTGSAAQTESDRQGLRDRRRGGK
jgi:hypothetical protein